MSELVQTCDTFPRIFFWKIGVVVRIKKEKTDGQTGSDGSEWTRFSMCYNFESKPMGPSLLHTGPKINVVEIHFFIIKPTYPIVLHIPMYVRYVQIHPINKIQVVINTYLVCIPHCCETIEFELPVLHLTQCKWVWDPDFHGLPLSNCVDIPGFQWLTEELKRKQNENYYYYFSIRFCRNVCHFQKVFL